jgi:RNA polymerase sigma-70 factor (ECF subfamily)
VTETAAHVRSLAAELRRHVRPDVAGRLPPDELVEAALERLVAAGQGAWPQVALDAPSFVAHLGRTLAPDAPVDDLGSLCAADLFLVAACAAGDERAVQVFHEHHVVDIRASARKLGATGAMVDEVAQRVLRELLVAEPGRPPRVGGYSGRGTLRAWLRTVTVRTFMKAARAAGGGPVIDDQALADGVAAADDPELEYMKRLYGQALDRVFGAALGELTPRERNLLRQHHLAGLTLEELAAFYRVHRATVARWLARARDALVTGIRSRLAGELGLSPSEIESVIRLVQSRIHVSLALEAE